MGPLLRVFDVPLASVGARLPPPATERAEKIDLHATGDAAKREARAALEARGLTVRSLNWGPGAHGALDLIAYVTPKEEKKV